jgi:hypothetical protein
MAGSDPTIRLDQVSPAHAKQIDAMLHQLLIVLVNRLGGVVDVPCAEVDNTAGYVFALKVNPDTRVFTFEVRRRQ